MASYKEHKEHAYSLITKDLKGGKICKPLLFHGEEKYLMEWATQLLIKSLIQRASRDLDLSVIEEEGVSLDEIKATCETFPMLSEKRLVVLKNYKGFSDPFIAYMSQIPDTCQLIITSEGMDQKTKAYKELIKYCQEYEFSRLEEGDLKKYILKRLKASDKVLKTSVLNQLILMTGYYDKDSEYTILNLENDIKKLIAYSPEEEIKLEDIANVLSGNVETNVYEMIDAVSSNKKGEAYQLLHNILTSGEKLYYLLAVLIGQFETILEVKELREEGHTLQEMKKILGIHEFRVKKAMGYAEKFSANNLKTTLSSLYEVDRNIKNGLIDGVLALEIIIARI